MSKSIKEIVNETESIYYKKLKISVGGYSISESGNITLQTWKKDKRFQITLHNELKINEEQLETFLDKVFYIDNVLVNKKWDKVKNVEVKGQESYFGILNKENLKDLGKYNEDSTENGVFEIYFDSKEPLPLTNVEEIEVSEWVDGKLNKVKKLSFTTKKRVKGKVSKKVYITNLSNKNKIMSLKGKNVLVSDIYTSGTGNFKKYFTDILPKSI
jgi:hypothetical protein